MRKQKREEAEARQKNHTKTKRHEEMERPPLLLSPLFFLLLWFFVGGIRAAPLPLCVFDPSLGITLTGECELPAGIYDTPFFNITAPGTCLFLFHLLSLFPLFDWR